jgi:F-box-like
MASQEPPAGEPSHEPFHAYTHPERPAAGAGRSNVFDPQGPAGGIFGELSAREVGLGTLDKVTDGLLLRILKKLANKDPKDLCALAQCSRVLNVLCSEDFLWKPIVIRLAAGGFRFRRSWKRTALDVRFVQCGRGDELDLASPAPPQILIPGFQSTLLYRAWYRGHVSVDQWAELPPDLPAHRTVPREKASELTVERFLEEYAKPMRPVIIQGIVEGWKCWKEKSWTFEALVERFGREVKFLTDEVDAQPDPQKLRMSLVDYLAYGTENHDEDPIYVFDSKFGDREGAKDLVDDYEVPEYFPASRFSDLTDAERPPFRWFIVGPKRTGTQFHVDPYVLCVCGLVFPPSFRLIFYFFCLFFMFSFADTAQMPGTHWWRGGSAGRFTSTSSSRRAWRLTMTLRSGRSPIPIRTPIPIPVPVRTLIR